MAVSKDMIVGEVLDKYPAAAEIFMGIGMHCLHCPSARGESIEDACKVHGVDADELVKKIEEVIK